MPTEVRVLLQRLAFAISLGFEGLPLSCLGAKGYVRRLLLWMLAPWAAVLVFVIAMVAQLQILKRVSTKSSQRTTLRFSQGEDRVTTAHILVKAIQRVTPMVLRIFFLAFPIVTNVAFEAFSCFPRAHRDNCRLGRSLTPNQEISLKKKRFFEFR